MSKNIEYKLLELGGPPPADESRLNTFAGQGWRVVGVYPTPGPRATVILERDKE